MTQPNIMLVDDNITSLTEGKNILKDLYKVYPVASAETMFDLLEHMVPELILLDVEMPVMNGYEAIEKLKATPELAEIPVIFLTSHADEVNELKGFSLGAIDYITKPFSAPLLLRRIETHLLMQSQRLQLRQNKIDLENDVKVKTEKIISLQFSIISTVADLVEFRDSTTGGHVARTQKYMDILFNELKSKSIYQEETADWDIDLLLPSAQLHDVGKIAISDTILNKPGKLTAKEYEIMKTHVDIGLNTIKQIEQATGEHRLLKHARLIVGGHHEKWDGSGYPLGLSGNDIPLEGRLMAIADVYDALVSNRPYKRPITTEEAKQMIVNSSGTHFDPKLIPVFDGIADKFAAVVRNLMY